jgi:hypothetical protein
MLLTMRTVLVVLLGVALGFVLYVAANSMFGQMVGPFGMNENFAALISTWRATGGSADAIGGDSESDGGPRGFGGGGLGGGRFGEMGEHRAVPITKGLHLSSAPAQTGSDLMWMGIPAAGAVLFEIGLTALTRRRRKTVA